MASLDDLKKRISSVKSTQKITKAMKMVAAAKLRKAQESAEKGRPYSQKMQNIILNLTNTINDPQNAPKLLVGNGNDKISVFRESAVSGLFGKVILGSSQEIVLSL